MRYAQLWTSAVALALLTQCCFAGPRVVPGFLGQRRSRMSDDVVPNYPVVCHNRTVLVDVALTFQPREPDTSGINIIPLLWQAFQFNDELFAATLNLTLFGVPESKLGFSIITPQGEDDSCQGVLSPLTNDIPTLVNSFKNYDLYDRAPLPLNTWGAIQHVATDPKMKWRKQKDPKQPPVIKVIVALTSSFDNPASPGSGRTCSGKPYPTVQEVADTLRKENVYLAMLVDSSYMAKWKKTLDSTDINYILTLYNFAVTTFMEDIMRVTQQTVCQIQLPDDGGR